MNNDYEILRMNIWLRVIFIFIGIFSIYAVAVQPKYHIGHQAFGKTIFISIGLFLVIASSWLVYFKIDRKGIAQVLGFQGKNGKLFGWSKLIKWDKMNIVVYDIWPSKLIAFEESKMPRFSAYLSSNYKAGMRMIAKYGMRRIVHSSDKEYFRKFLKED